MVLMEDRGIIKAVKARVDSSGASQPPENIPEQIDKTEEDTEKRLLVGALATEFRTAIQRNGIGPIKRVIDSLNIRTINSLLFDEKPNGIDKPYIDLIEDLLERPSYYCPDGNVSSAIQDGYLEHLKDLLKRVSSLLFEGETSEDSEDNKTSTAQYLEWRLTSLIARSQLIGFIVPKVSLAEKSNQTFEKNIKTFNTELSDYRQEIKGLKERETRSFQNMLTTMGVFTTIVVIVMSLVITASSWLNSANFADAVVAFIIPSCIAVLAVCALTALLPDAQGKKWIRWGIISFLTICIAAGSIFCYHLLTGEPFPRTAHHPVYGFNANDCIREEADVDDDGIEITKKVFDLEYFIPITTEDGEIKAIPIKKTVDYDPKLIHDGYIFYCIECDRLE